MNAPFATLTEPTVRRKTLGTLGALVTGMVAAARWHGGRDASAKKKNAHRGKDRRGRHDRDTREGESWTTAGSVVPEVNAAQNGTVADPTFPPLMAVGKKSKPGQQGRKGPTGPMGPTGPAGRGGQNETGPTGVQGPTDIARLAGTTIEAAQDTLDAVINQTHTIEARGPNLNSRLLGGGFDPGVSGAAGNDVEVNLAAPIAATARSTPGYRIKVTRRGTASGVLVQVTAYAIRST